MYADFLVILVFLGLLAVPVVSIYNLVGCFRIFKHKGLRNTMWAITLIAGFFDTYMYLGLNDVKFNAEWFEQLYNRQVHQPIWSGGWFSVYLICAIGIIGGCVLAATDVNKVPPLVTVIGMAAVYLFLAEMLIWSIQIFIQFDNSFLCYILTINILFIAINLFREKIKQWNENVYHSQDNYGKNPLIRTLNMSLQKAEHWPIIALLFVLPLMGIVLLILILFGQQPDTVIKAWTETSDWTLSGKEGPQNLYYDEHYLCTVAASGHKKVVRPVRKGVRHGHQVIVNRQLMIANAFENVLEEKTPRFHRVVRNFYDKYGFPVADYIRHNKVACDVTYFIMKPLEWIFLIVLYLVDVNPENRIAVQYLPAMGKE